MNDIKTSMRKLLSVILSITLIFSVLPVAFLQKAEAVATLRTDMRHPNGVDQYGTPCWNGSDGGLNYAKWTSSPDYLRVDYPRHIYLDISETLEEAGYYQTMTWHWGDSTDYRIIANGYLWGEKGNKNWSSGWGANWFTMENMFSNYRHEADVRPGGTTGTASDSDLILYDTWDNAYACVWRCNSGGVFDHVNHVYLMGTPNAVGTGQYSTSGAGPAFGGTQKWERQWFTTKWYDKLNFTKDGPNFEVNAEAMMGTWKEVKFDITIYNKADLNTAVTNANTIYSQNNGYTQYERTGGWANFTSARTDGQSTLTTRVNTQGNLDTKKNTLNTRMSALEFRADRTSLDNAITAANNRKAEKDYAARYTQASRNAVETALTNANAFTLVTYKAFNGTNVLANAGQQAANQQTQITNLVTALNNAVAGLTYTNTPHELGYDNEFIFNEWANSNSATCNPARGNMSVDSANGTISMTCTAGDEVYTSHELGITDYNLNLTPGQNYTLSFDLDSAGNGQAFVFFHDSMDNATWIDLKATYCEGGHRELNFTVPAGTVRTMIRFGVQPAGNSGTFSNIKIVKSTVPTDITYSKIREVRTGNNYGTLITPTRPGYVFGGWFTGENGTGTQIASGSATAGYNTVYSKWTLENYTVTFNANGGTAVSNKTYNVTQTVTIPSTTYGCKTFNGWLASNASGNWVNGETYQPGNLTGKYGNVTLTAQWGAEVHTGGTATCKTQAKCTNCGQYYGTTDPNNHEGGTELRGVIAAT